jgi:ATP/maltotriose-dependent transcriptional regulator MalT
VPRHLASLHDAASAGRLGDGDVMMLARSLAWHGRAGEAVEVLAPLGDLATHPDPDVAAGYRATREWLHHCVPGDVSSGGSTVDHAEQVLQRARVGESVLVAVWQALRVLIHAGRLDRATDWCERLHEAAEARAAVGWRAVLSDVWAAIALRRGELVAAERHARTALSTMSARSWGIAIGSPLAHLVLACTLTGKLAQAEEIVWQATPAAMRQSLFWPAYLRARGVYYDAADRPHAALADFQAAGEHVVRWHADDPSALPWRVDLARVHVNLGRTDAAREILAEHLALADGPRPRGIGLRVLASSCPPKQRQAMLREAVDLLHASGDRYELAHAFADLSEAGHALGEFGRAKMMGRRAMQLAESCHAEPLRRKLQPVCAEPESRDDDAMSGFDALSDAERRVVNLAARGHTNREIGNKLFITVSTVEQHLTRAYRKLNISRRTDLVPVGPLEEAYA